MNTRLSILKLLKQKEFDGVESNILERGCLVSLICSVWGTDKKLPSGTFNTVDVEADPDYVNSKKSKIDKKHLDEINKIRGQARTFLYDRSLPFPIPGFWFVPKDITIKVNDALLKFKEEFDRCVDEFMLSYTTYIDEARQKLGKLFNPLDYPQDVRGRFCFTWNFVNFTAPGSLQMHTPEMVEHAKSEFNRTIEEFRELAITTLRSEMAQLVGHLVERLADNGKKFKASTITNIKEFITDFTSLNIANDVDLQLITERCKSVLDGVNIEAIRTDESLRQSIASTMGEVKAQLDLSMVNRPIRRLVSFAKKEN